MQQNTESQCAAVFVCVAAQTKKYDDHLPILVRTCTTTKNKSAAHYPPEWWWQLPNGAVRPPSPSHVMLAGERLQGRRGECMQTVTGASCSALELKNVHSFTFRGK
jgi:hypothetical protein